MATMLQLPIFASKVSVTTRTPCARHWAFFLRHQGSAGEPRSGEGGEPPTSEARREVQKVGRCASGVDFFSPPEDDWSVHPLSSDLLLGHNAPRPQGVQMEKALEYLYTKFILRDVLSYAV